MPVSPTAEGPRGEVRRILYKDQHVEDNHTVQETFLQTLRVNPDVQKRDLGAWIGIVYDAGILQAVSKVVAFLGVFLLEVESEPFWQRLQLRLSKNAARLSLSPVHVFAAVVTALLLLNVPGKNGLLARTGNRRSFFFWGSKG
jgi:hypothetical protein